MKIAWSVLFAVVLLAGELRGQEAPAPTLTKWSGFGPGSYMQMKVRTEVGKVVTEEYSLRKILLRLSREGEYLLKTYRLPLGLEKPKPQQFLPGITLERAGLRLRSSKDETLMVEGQPIAVTAKRYVADNTNADSMRIAFNAKEAADPQSKAKLPLFQAELTLYEVKDGTLRVPYQELETFGATIALSPRIVRVNLELIHTLEGGGVAKRMAFESTLRTLREAVQVAGKPVLCTVFDEIDERSQGTEFESTRTCRLWLSEEMPGRFVRLDQEVRNVKNGTEQAVRNVAEVESFSIEPEIRDVDPKTLPPLAKRATIPGNDWKGVHEGAWQLLLEQNLDTAANKDLGKAVHTMQVVRMLEEGPVVCQKSIGLGPVYWMGLQWFPFDREEKKPLQPNGEKQSVKINGEDVPCELQTRPASDGLLRGKETVWIPLDAAWKRRLADARLDYVRSQTELTSPDGASTMRILDLVRFRDRVAKVGRRELTCLETATEVTLNGKSQFRADCLWSDQVPGGKVLITKLQNRLARRLQILDFGEADQPIPDKAEIDRLVEAADRTLNSIKTMGK